jgi:4-amino-4-deoxy-L-arabinose transferase-like glycosyltransferase
VWNAPFVFPADSLYNSPIVRSISRSATGSCLFLILVWFWTVFFRLGALPLSGADEPRYARIAQEMLQEGRWITPVLEGKPWLEKPPLYYWITIPVYRFFGTDEAAARLGPAVLGLLTALVVLWVGNKMWGAPAGLISATILLTSLGFAGFARSASMDMPVTALLTAAVGVLGVAVVGEGLAPWKIWAGYAALGLAILAKGPVALVLAAGIGLLFWCLDERGGSLRRWCPVRGLAITAAVALPWHWLAFRQNGFFFITMFFINHNLARYVSDLHHHSQPFYYFIPVLLGLFFPWSGWLPLAAPSRKRLRAWREWDRGTLFTVVWAVFPFLFFSASTSKLPGYILPVLPPTALLLGANLAALPERTRSWKTGWRGWVYLAMTVAVAIGAFIFFARVLGGGWQQALWIAAATAAPAPFAFLYSQTGRWKQVVTATAIQGGLLMIAVALAGFTALGSRYSTREVARAAVARQLPGERITTYCFFQHTLFYYTGYRVATDFRDGRSVADFLADHDSVLVVTEERRVPELRQVEGLTLRELASQGQLRLLRVLKAGTE